MTEKYGVDTSPSQEDYEKTGSVEVDWTKCPLCGSELIDTGASICPIHGSKPFEAPKK